MLLLSCRFLPILVSFLPILEISCPLVCPSSAVCSAHHGRDVNSTVAVDTLDASMEIRGDRQRVQSMGIDLKTDLTCGIFTEAPSPFSSKEQQTPVTANATLAPTSSWDDGQPTSRPTWVYRKRRKGGRQREKEIRIKRGRSLVSTAGENKGPV